MPNCKHCSQPTPSKTRTVCDNCLHSPEALARRSIAIKMGWQSSEYRVGMAAAMKIQWDNLEYRTEMSAAMNTHECKTKLSSIMKAIWKSAEAKARHAQLVADGRIGFKGRGKQTQYTSKAGIEYTFRSTWELKVAEYFDAQNIPWDYELDVLTLYTEAYLPDFFIFDEHGGLVKIVEVKGWFPPESQAKMARFQCYLAAQGIPLEVWSTVKLKELGIL